MMIGVWLRSLAYAAVQVLVTPPYSIVALLTFPFPPLTRYRVISGWARFMTWAAQHICGIRYRVLGSQNIPHEPCIVLVKHESAWETLALQVIFPPQVWVLKRELLWIPFFGWGLAMTSPVAIDRKAGMRALKQMLAQGKDRLQHGFWIVVFPEGTRMAAGETRRYGSSGTLLAAQENRKIVPVAHNAGYFWPRRGVLKKRGTIRVIIGPPIEAAGRDAREVNNEVQAWIESHVMPPDSKAD